MPIENIVPETLNVVSETSSVDLPVETEETVTCERCEDEVDIDNAQHVSNQFGWSDCYLCNSCYDHEEEMEGDDEEEEEEITQYYDDSLDKGDCPTLTDEEVLNSIDSKCTFGLEFETYGGVKDNPTRNTAREMGYTYSGDGSINGNNAIEYQTPVLKGKSGAKSVIDFLAVANKSELKVNDSCGTHVHLGALDFFDEFKFTLSDLEKSLDEEKIVVERTLLLNMADVITNKDDLAEWLNDMYMRGQQNDMYSTTYRMKNGKISRYSVAKIFIRNVGGDDVYGGRNYVYNYVVRDSQLDRLNITSEDIIYGNKSINVGKRPLNERNSNRIYVNGEDIVVYSRPRSEKYHKLKALFYTYSVFEKLFFAMLPENRKENNYCNPLSKSYSLRDISRCNSQEDIEKLWYKKLSLREVAQAKQNHYEESRYHSLNLHAMFYKYGTVEIRIHHGTLQAHSILMWVALHQAILNAVLQGKFNFLFNMNLRRDLRTIVDYYKLLIKTLGIQDTPLQKFIKHRIDKYSPKSLLEIK